MSRRGARPARAVVFSNRDSIFLSLLFDMTCFMSISCLCWHLLSVLTLLCPCGRLHDSGAPGIGRQVVGWQTKRWGGRFFRWGGTCHPISIQSYAPDSVSILSRFWKYNCPRCFSPYFAFPASNQHRITSLTRALLGLWIFHHLLGGGGVWTPPPPVYLGYCAS